METIDEATANEDLHNLILNAIKSIRNIKKCPDCSVIYDYLIKILPNTKKIINEENVSNRLEYLTNSNTLKNRPNNGRDPYFIVNETNQNMSDISPEQILCPVNFKTPSVKLKRHQVYLTKRNVRPLQAHLMVLKSIYIKKK